MASRRRVSVQNVIDAINCDDSDVDGYEEDSDDDEDYVPPANAQVRCTID